MTRLRWGVLSTAKIGTAKVIPALQASELCVVTAIASRDVAKAEDAARALGIARPHGSYEDLLEDPNIDAVYVPLPNHLHVEWSIRALRAGKHVLCEKPIGLTAADGEVLVAEAARHPRLKIMEAFMYRHHPQWHLAREVVMSGGVGDLRAIDSLFSYFNNDPANIRNQPEIGGGGLMDIGCYCVSLARWLFDREPARVVARVDTDSALGIDRLVSGLLDFEGGTSTFTCSTQLEPYQRVQILGTAGRVEIEIPFNAPPDRPCRLWHQRGGGIEEISVEACDQYTIQGDLFARAVFDDTDIPTPLADAVANMRVIEALFASGRSDRWERPTARRRNAASVEKGRK